MAEEEAVARLLDRVVRRERGRLIAGLVHRLGPHRLELAEDVAQEAVMAALAVWPYQPLPENPGAWLARVATNKAIDRLRREGREQALDLDLDPDRDSGLGGRGQGAGPAGSEPAPPSDLDPELQLIFLACHPSLTPRDRLSITLRIVSGFTARELGELFLCSEASMAQRLTRARRRLRRLGPTALRAEGAQLGSGAPSGRLEDVLKGVYLMFSLGYAPRSGARLIRRDVAFEALRLACLLAENPATACPQAHALAALLCFQASRFDAREDRDGRPVLLPDQDRTRWDRASIDRALAHLAASAAGDSVSRYHLEAGIAACHATARDWHATDWASIVRLYAELEALTDSPVVRVNAAVARAFAADAAGDSACEALASLDVVGGEAQLSGYAPFHIARAEILRTLGREEEARVSYREAIACGVSAPVMTHLEERLLSGA